MPLIVVDGSLFKFVYRAEEKHLPVFRIKRNRNSVPYHRPGTAKQPDESDFGFVVLHNIHRIVPASSVADDQVTVNDEMPSSSSQRAERHLFPMLLISTLSACMNWSTGAV